MKLTPWYLAALAPIAVAGCSGSGALMGHVAVLAVAVGIFVGTLSLGRQSTSSTGLATAAVTQLEATVAPLAPLDTVASSHETV